MKIVYILTLVLFSSVAKAESFVVTSSPANAEVWVKKNATDPGRKLGETPYTGTLEELYSVSPDGKTSFLQISLKGHVSKEFILISNDDKSKLELSVNLIPEPVHASEKKHDTLISEVLKAQALIRSRNYGGAISKLDELEKDYKNFSVIPELKGIAYYMSKDMEKALSMFRTAFSLNSENSDAYKMKVYLEKKMGIDAEGSK